MGWGGTIGVVFLVGVGACGWGRYVKVGGCGVGWEGADVEGSDVVVGGDSCFVLGSLFGKAVAANVGVAVGGCSCDGGIEFVVDIQWVKKVESAKISQIPVRETAAKGF